MARSKNKQKRVRHARDVRFKRRKDRKKVEKAATARERR
jgi:hypothetical protein